MAVTGFVRGVVKMTAQGDEILNTRMYITMLRWISKDAVADHDMSLTDGSGNVLWESVADGADFIDAHPLFKRVDGIIAATLDSGELYIYID